MNYYSEIKDKLIDNEIYSKVKDYSKERHKLETYYEVGKLLSEAGKHYGEGIIKEYYKKLSTSLFNVFINNVKESFFIEIYKQYSTKDPNKYSHSDYNDYNKYINDVFDL